MEREKVTIKKLQEMKARKETITMLSAYDYPLGQAIDRAGIDIACVGDSLGMVVLGYEGTVPVTMEQMIHHCKAVTAGCKKALVVGDMPFGSYNESKEDAIRNGNRFLKEGGADAVLLEGGERVGDIIKALVKAGIPVMGHLGVTPQTVAMQSGYKVRGTGAKEAYQLRREIYFAMITVAFAQMLYTIVYKWKSLTGGDDGLAGIPFAKITLFGNTFNFNAPGKYFYVTLVFFVISMALLRLIIKSPFGQILRGVRENATRVEFIGLNPQTYKLAAFIIAGFFGGLAGILFAPYAGTVAPDIAHWSNSTEPLFMTVAGGLGQFWGPAVGTAVYMILKNVFTSSTQHWMLILGSILVFIVLAVPGGITGFLMNKMVLFWNWRGRSVESRQNSHRLADGSEE